MKETDTSSQFNYDEAFSRNIGLLTLEEQQKLRNFTIAIPGMGGVGGAHFISLVRQGFEKFKIADFDVFELKNFNRQYGSRMDTLQKRKVDVMKEEALKINPNCTIEIFDSGIHAENINLFLKDVDLSVDGIDAFEVDVRRMFYNESLKKGIPLITAGPIGFSAAFLIFMPGGPTFDEYFAVKDSTSYLDKLAAFLVGLTPSLLQRTYMHDINLKEKRGSSSVGAINLCAGIVTIHALKILLKKGKVKAVPYYQQFDVMRNIYVAKRLHFGNYNPIQQIKMRLLKFMMKG
ncbi:MAG: ThiF family adenylyltransferase [Minisyncoccia bacterium]